MFDAKLRPLIDPPLNAIGRRLAGLGVRANLVTLGGLLLGIAAGVALSQQAYVAGLVLIVSSRVLDGLDGAVARATRTTDFGGYFDSVADYGFYVAVSLGLAFADRENMPVMLLLIASFILTAVSFLAFAAIAAKRGLETSAHGKKSFYYSNGLAEGTETILAFALMCLFPTFVPMIGAIFAGLCLLTVVQRVISARRIFAETD